MDHYRHFSKAERQELSILLSKGYSMRAIAQAMNRNDAISREMKRKMCTGEYDAEKAHQKARNKRRRSKYQGMKVRASAEIEAFVREKMRLCWSPEQIAGVLFLEQGIALGKDAIYKYLYSAHGQSLCVFLYRKRYCRKRRRKQKMKHEIIKDRIFIGERPKEIDSRKRFGDYEGDTMGRPKKVSPSTLVVVRERLSRKLLKGNIVHSLTLDNGVENAHYQKLNIPTYFCDPYSSWQKGSVENGIGRIRRFIPKKSDLKNFSQKEIDAYLETLNNTPMKILGFKTPNQVFASFSSS